MKVSVLVENTKKDNCLACEHGLSLFIEYKDKAYLIDAGSTDIFMENARDMDLCLDKVKTCFLSHGHYDHSGGFYTFLKKHKDCTLYCMDSVFDAYYSGSNDHIHYIGVPESLYALKDRMIMISKDIEIEESIYCICHHSHNLKEIGLSKKLYRLEDGEYKPDDFSHEMSVVFKSEKGLIVVNSCCHAGIINVIKEVQDTLKEPIYAFIGGLHMKGKKNGKEICTFHEEEINELASFINNNHIHIYTGHCTGEIGYNLLKEKVESIHTLYTGKVFEL
ncbi:MAG: MBL fold metallo-hydrolase [Holdemanella sp.]|nr:MBL fold metallo-hydrolase [Holdemanella sp.]